MPKRGRPRNFDRDKALHRAMEVFWEQGFDSTSMADLIDAMQINSPSIYAAFGSKEKLFQETVSLYITLEGSKIWRSMSTEPSAKLAIQTMLQASARVFTQTNKPRGCLIMLGALHTTEGNPDIQQKLAEHRSQCITMVHSRLKRAVQENELADGPNWRAIAAFYVSVLQGMSMQACDGATRKTLLAVADCAMAAWNDLTTA